MKKKIKLILFLILLLIVIFDFFMIDHLQKKLNNLKIITYIDSSVVFVSPKIFKKDQILFTASFIDQFNKYRSPFKDNLDFDQLIHKYIRNRWSDHYGAIRGTRECKRIHEGIDLYTPENTPVYPLADYGIVTLATDNPHYMMTVQCERQNGSIDSVKIEYGKTIRILYPEGIESLYTHLNEVFVKTGEVVDRSSAVGLTGMTGNIRRSGKPSHLHLELRDKDNKTFDPRYRLRFDQASVQHFLKFLEIDENGDE